MRRLLLAACLLHAGCEGCDFSFGPIPVSATVTLEDLDGAPLSDARVPQAALCVGDAVDCVPIDADDDGVFRTYVSWEGYVQCRRPDLVLQVDAPGCEPWEEALDGVRYGAIDGPAAFDAVLTCEPLVAAE